MIPLGSHGSCVNYFVLCCAAVSAPFFSRSRDTTAARVLLCCCVVVLLCCCVVVLFFFSLQPSGEAENLTRGEVLSTYIHTYLPTCLHTISIPTSSLPLARCNAVVGIAG